MDHCFTERTVLSSNPTSDGQGYAIATTSAQGVYVKSLQDTSDLVGLLWGSGGPFANSEPPFLGKVSFTRRPSIKLHQETDSFRLCTSFTLVCSGTRTSATVGQCCPVVMANGSHTIIRNAVSNVIHCDRTGLVGW